MELDNVGGAMTTLLSGATGTIGHRLAVKLDDPRVLARSPKRVLAAVGRVPTFEWNSDIEVPPEAMEEVDAVVHLAGERVAEGRWTDEKRALILESRVRGTRRIVEAIAVATPRPRLLIVASAVGFYGSRGDELLDEKSAPGEGFLADVCRAWEAEAAAATTLGVRVVLARFGHVLAPEAGILARMLPMFGFGLGGPLGSGAQWMPWIHVADVVGLLLHAFEHTEIEGPMNVCAPEAVTNREFARELGRVLNRPAFLPVPASAIRLAFGDLASMILASERVVPAVALRTGYAFRFDSLDAALRDLTRPTRESRDEVHP
jgi:uncharacterized protein (TIGR01777 family)